MEQPKRMSTLVKIVLALVALNVVLCAGVAVYLTMSRAARQQAEAGTPMGRVATPTPTRTVTPGGPTLTPTPTRSRPTNTARPASTGATATRPPVPPASATPAPPQPTQPPQPTPPAATPAPAGTIILNDPTLQDLLTVLANARAGQAVQANISQGALDAQIRDALSASPDATYQHQEIRLEGGRLLLIGRGQLQGITAPVEVTARLYASECRLAIDIERMRIAGLPAPRFLVDQVSASARQWADNYLATFNYCVEQVSMVNQQVVLAGRVR